MSFIRFMAIFLCAYVSFAEGTVVQVVLDLADSRNLFDVMKGVDSAEWFQVVQHTNSFQVRRDTKRFQTQDESMVINCTADLMFATMMNHACVVSFDRAKVRGENVIESKAPGLLYGFINSRADSIAFYERFLMPLQSFQSIEKAPVKTIDQGFIHWFRFYAHCSLENDGPYLKIPRACTISGISHQA